MDDNEIELEQIKEEISDLRFFIRFIVQTLSEDTVIEEKTRRQIVAEMEQWL